jgi:YfiH family protein
MAQTRSRDLEGGRSTHPPIRPSDYPTLRESPLADPAVPRMELTSWAEHFGVVAGVTTRGHGFSLGLWSQEPVGQVMTRWRAFRAAQRRVFPAQVLSHQVHGTEVRWHDRIADGGGWLVLDGVDGHATSAPGLLLTITVADCIPVYLAVPEKGAIALLHAGWRGTAGRILERGVEVLKRQAFAVARDIVMHCGVGICGSCYEVGSEVAERLGMPAGEGTSHVDLRQVLAVQAADLGIREITISPWCSAHDRAEFFSHRASGGADGRQVAYLGRPLA